MKINLHTVLLPLALALVFFSMACGGGSSNSLPVNPPLPPSGLAILSSPPAQASEGSVYSYSLQGNVQGATFVLTGSPSGAALSGSTINWTPTPQQARTANQFTVTASYSGATATQNWSVTPGGYIRGTTVDTCVSDSGQTTTISYLSGATVQALVPRSGGGFDTYNGNIALDGTFSIPNVPPGSFWLMSPGTNLLWTSKSAVDLGHRYWGNCHRELPSSPGTSFQATVNGLNPWQYYDYFYFVVPNAITGKGALASVGGTSLSFTIPYGNLLLLNAANGDNGYFAQLVTATFGGIPFYALQQFAGPFPITVQNGVANSMTATLQPTPQSNTFRANIRGSAFTALHDSMFPGASNTSPGDNLRVDITADKTGPSSLGLFLVLASHAFNSDTDAGDVPYANPYPQTWTPFLDYTDMAVYNILPFSPSTFQQVLVTRVVSTDFPTASKPIVPLVGPALNPQINGGNLFPDQVISGTTPTITWQPPAVGTATGYRIRVYQLTLNSPNQKLDFKGSLYTTATSALLPPGLLTSGNSYCFVIESLYRTNDISVSPNLGTFPQGESDLGSGVITVQ